MSRSPGPPHRTVCGYTAGQFCTKTFVLETNVRSIFKRFYQSKERNSSCSSSYGRSQTHACVFGEFIENA